MRKETSLLPWVRDCCAKRPPSLPCEPRVRVNVVNAGMLEQDGCVRINVVNVRKVGSRPRGGRGEG